MAWHGIALAYEAQTHRVGFQHPLGREVLDRARAYPRPTPLLHRHNARFLMGKFQIRMLADSMISEIAVGDCAAAVMEFSRGFRDGRGGKRRGVCDVDFG